MLSTTRTRQAYSVRIQRKQCTVVLGPSTAQGTLLVSRPDSWAEDAAQTIPRVVSGGCHHIYTDARLSNKYDETNRVVGILQIEKDTCSVQATRIVAEIVVPGD